MGPGPAIRGFRAKLVLSFGIVYLVWGSSYLVTRVGVSVLPPFLFGGIRFVIAGVLLSAVARLFGGGGSLDPGDARHALVTGLCLVFMSNGGNAWGLQRVESNQAALLNASASFWIVILGLFGARAHRPALRVAVGVVIGFLGTALIVWRGEAPARPSYLSGELAILLGCLGWAAGTIYLRNASPRGDLLAFTGLQLVLGGLMLIALGLATGEAGRWSWNPIGLAAMAYMIIASSCIAYTAYIWLTRHVSPASVGTYGYVNPAVATVLGWLLLGERLSSTQVFGMVVMLVGVILVTWPTREIAPESPG